MPIATRKMHQAIHKLVDACDELRDMGFTEDGVRIMFESGLHTKGNAADRVWLHYPDLDKDTDATTN